MSPVVRLEIYDQNSTFKSESLLIEGLMELSVDYPEDMNLTQNLCLGYVSESSWKCESREYTKSNNQGKLIYKFKNFGWTYAVIYLPDPDVFAWYYCQEWWVCWNH